MSSTLFFFKEMIAFIYSMGPVNEFVHIFQQVYASFIIGICAFRGRDVFLCCISVFLLISVGVH